MLNRTVVMPPLFSYSVVCFVFLACRVFWVFECGSSLKVNEYVQTRLICIEIQGLNVPGRGDAQGCLKQVFHG